MTAQAHTLLLFGATGDLSRRMLLPSLAALHAEKLVHEDLRIVGTARSEMSDGEFRNFAREALEKFLPAERRGGMADFLNRLSYQQLDVTAPEGFAKLAEKAGPGENLAIFLSTAPGLFKPTIEGLAKAGLAGEGARISLEKPLGTDLASSAAINDAVAIAFPEARIFRIDHYLGKETVQNLLALRFANLMFEPIWRSQYIEHVQITVADVRDGACSSSTLQEAASWGKVNTGIEQMVFAEAGSVMPLLASDAYHRGHWKDRVKRRWGAIFA